mgnify:CR=1 FL=1
MLAIKRVKSGISSILNKIRPNKQIEDLQPKAPTELLSQIKFKSGFIDIVLENKIDADGVENKLFNQGIKYLIFTRNCESQDYINDYTFENVFKYRAFIYIYSTEPCEHKNAVNININENWLKAIKELDKTLNGLTVYANYNPENVISVKTPTFFNSFGTNYYSGGAERYLLDLFEVCHDMGFNLNVYQFAEIPFIRKYNNLNIIGLPYDSTPDYSYQFLDQQTKNYIYHTYNNTQLHIYSAFQECYPNHIGPSIGIGHGVSWDGKTNHFDYGMECFWENKKKYLYGAAYCDKLISVDTNTPNWFQTVDYKLGNQKFRVIPNYVETNEFSPRKDYLKQQEKIVITYPRRLYEPRGLYIVLDIVDEILEKYSNVEFHFVGKGFPSDTDNIDEKIKMYPSRIKRYSKKPSEMKDVYRYSDISLIPTQYSEGTSLSCLEALASGNLVIATRIGGLTDLIINGFNGYLIEPSSANLKDALVNALDNFEAQNDIRKRAVESAKAFNKNLWKQRWTKEIASFNLKQKSYNNELIEFYCNDLCDLNENDLKIIKKELLLQNLVYIRIPNAKEYMYKSLGLLQILDFDEEIVSQPKIIYNKIHKPINRIGKVICIE